LNATQEVDLGTRFESVGDMRHWLHQKGVEVELTDTAALKLPGSGKIAQVVEEKISDIDDETVAIFNGFFHMVSFWTPNQYWFEAFELRPVGILALTEESGKNDFESGQVVGLSAVGVETFAKLLVQCGFVNNKEKISEVLKCVHGVVRTGACDVRLLMYLKFPWALSTSSGTVARDVPESFADVSSMSSILNSRELRDCGRLGSDPSSPVELLEHSNEAIKRGIETLINKKSAADSTDESSDPLASVRPGDSLLHRLETVPEGETPYWGYIVDWITPREISNFLTMEPVVESMADDPPVAEEEAVVLREPVAPVEDLSALPVTVLRERLKALGLPLTGRKVDLLERLTAHLTQTPPAEAIDVDMSPKSVASADFKMFKCIVELPRALMRWGELTNNLTGPGNSHFNHIKQQCPSVTVSCQGSASAALVGEARLHVQLVAVDAKDFAKAKSLVEDLVRAVVEVGADVCLVDESPAVRAATIREVKVVDS
jgi:hypothetical protein